MNKSNWERLRIARKTNRNKSSDFIEGIFDDFIELSGDRRYGEDNSIIAGIGMIENTAFTIIAQGKGKNIREQLCRNFGMTKPEGYRKALRIMRQAEKFNRPIITFVDTPGAYPGVEAEERGQSQAIAENIFEMSKLKVPIITIIIGEGCSGGALGIGVADKIAILDNGIFKVASPETVASIIYKDSKKAEYVANKMKISARELKSIGVVDEIFIENNEIMQTARKYIMNSMRQLRKLNCEELLKLRYNKYRKF